MKKLCTGKKGICKTLVGLFVLLLCITTVEENSLAQELECPVYDSIQEFLQENCELVMSDGEGTLDRKYNATVYNCFGVEVQIIVRSFNQCPWVYISGSGVVNAL